MRADDFQYCIITEEGKRIYWKWWACPHSPLMALCIVFVEMWHFGRKRVIYIQHHGNHKMESTAKFTFLYLSSYFPAITQRTQAPGMKINVVKVYEKKYPFYNEQSPLKELRHNRPSLGLKIASPPKKSLTKNISLSFSLSQHLWSLQISMCVTLFQCLCLSSALLL